MFVTNSNDSGSSTKFILQDVVFDVYGAKY